MAKEFSLNTEFDVVFDENLNVISNVNIGSIPQTSNETFSIRVKVPPTIVDVNNDSCYLALVLPTTNKNFRLKLPTTLFNDFVLNEDGSYYESVFNVTASAVRYVGKVLVNLVIRHNTGVQEEQVVGDTELDVDLYTTKSSSTFNLIVTRSSNYSENLYPDEEDEYEEAVDHINSIMDSLSGFASRFINYESGIRVFNTLPANLIDYANTMIYVKSNKSFYFVNQLGIAKIIIVNEKEVDEKISEITDAITINRIGLLKVGEYEEDTGVIEFIYDQDIIDTFEYNEDSGILSLTY